MTNVKRQQSQKSDIAYTYKSKVAQNGGRRSQGEVELELCVGRQCLDMQRGEGK